MFNQSISIIEYPPLYNILIEIKSLFKFNINYYKSLDDFIDKIKSNNFRYSNTIVIVSNKDHKLFSIKDIDKNNILILDDLPLKIEKFIVTKEARDYQSFVERLQIFQEIYRDLGVNYAQHLFTPDE